MLPMPQLGGGTGFAEELLGLGRVKLVLAGDLDGDGPIQLGVVRLPDRPVRPHADLLDQLKVADRLRRPSRRWSSPIRPD